LDGSATSARLHFSDGTSAPFPFDHDTGIGTWTGSAEPVSVQTGAATCSLQLVSATPGNQCMGSFG
jgi:hypothetical protein